MWCISFVPTSMYCTFQWRISMLTRNNLDFWLLTMATATTIFCIPVNTFWIMGFATDINPMPPKHIIFCRLFNKLYFNQYKSISNIFYLYSINVVQVEMFYHKCVINKFIIPNMSLLYFCLSEIFKPGFLLQNNY